MSGRKRTSAPGTVEAASETEKVELAVSVSADETVPVEVVPEGVEPAADEPSPETVEGFVELVAEPVADVVHAPTLEEVAEYAQFTVVSCAVLRTHDGEEVYRYGGAIVTGEQFTVESLEHAYIVGAITETE